MDVKLVMFKANGQRKDFPVINPTTVIGRAESCDLRVPLLSVSRRQCALTVTDEGVKIRDLASSNGTYINNQRINEVEVSAGDRLVIGPIVFTLQIGGQPEEIQHFLLQTSILDRLSGDLCNAVTGRSDSHLLLEQLFNANLFLIPLDDERQWYRYHHLFADLLRSLQDICRQDDEAERHSYQNEIGPSHG